MNSDKALGHDGFSMAFFQTCWNGIKVDIMGCSTTSMLVVSLKKVSMPPSSLSPRRNSG
jgi:hypothetical protein